MIKGSLIMSGGSTRRIDETFQQLSGAGNAGQYDRDQILQEINRLQDAGAALLLTDLGKGWYDASGKLDDLRSRLQRVGERLAEAWRSQVSMASQRALMRIHDAAQELSGTADGMHRYTDRVGVTMGRHLAAFPRGDGEAAAERFMGDYGRMLASGAAGPAGLVPGSAAGDIGEAAYGTVGGWVDSGLNALGLGGGDPNQESQEALAALNRDLVADNEVMPTYVSVELPQIGYQRDTTIYLPPGPDPIGPGLPGDGELPGGEIAGGVPGVPGGGAGLPAGPEGRPETGPARPLESTPGGAPSGPDEPVGGLASAPGGPSTVGAGGSGGGGALAGGGGAGSGGGVPGGATPRPGAAPGIMPIGAGGTSTGGSGGPGSNSAGGSGRGAGGAVGRSRAGGGIVPIGPSGPSAGGGTGAGRRSGAGGAGAGRMAGGVMPMAGAGERGDEEERSAHENWLVDDDDPWGGDELGELPPGVIR
jgi:hypothetical protein